jgi:hypothetical protein
MERLLLCMVTAASISATAFFCAWLNYRDYPYFRIKQEMTRDDLNALRNDIVHYQDKTGRLPARLVDLDVVKNRRVMVDDTGRPVDYWRRPFHYHVKGDSYELYSLGQDGQPGGFGLDADLHAGKVDWETERLTLWQFTSLADTRGIKLTCLLAGILAFPLCLLGVKKGATNRFSPVKALVVHGMTAIFAVLTAVAISFLHLPSGH